MHRFIAVTMTAASFVCPCPTVYADPILVVVPNKAATADGNVSNIIPFAERSTFRYQQVYDQSQFPSVPLFISAISFRSDVAFGPQRFGLTSFAAIDFNLSTTTKRPDSLSLTFAENVGSDDTTVFSGPLSLASIGLGRFDITVPIAPFLYDPRLGNLLLDVRRFPSAGDPLFRENANIPPFDAHWADIDPGAGPFMGRTYTEDVTALVGRNTDTVGLVTQFAASTNISATPEPATIICFATGLFVLATRTRTSRRP